jgi:hypothetical protein
MKSAGNDPIGVEMEKDENGDLVGERTANRLSLSVPKWKVYEKISTEVYRA